MRRLRRSLGTLIGLLFFCVMPAAAQNADTQQSSSAEVAQASDALINVLNDPKSRAALIELLKQSASETQNAGETGSAPEEASTPGDSILPVLRGAGQPDAPAAQSDQSQSAATSENFALRVGEYTRELVDDAGLVLAQSVRPLHGLIRIGRGEIPIKWEQVKSIAGQVLVVLLAAYAGLLISKAAMKLLYPRMSAIAGRRGGLMRSFILILTSVLDAIAVGLGWAVGNAVALAGYGELQAGVTLQESLALNAFFIAELANVALRFIFVPAHRQLRLLPFTDKASRYWSSRLHLFVYWIVYGLFLVVPVANIAASFVLGNALRFLVVFLGTLYLLALVQRNRQNVCQGVSDYAQTLQSTLASRVLAVGGRVWHFAAYGYLAAVFIIWVTRPFDATSIILHATGLSIVAIATGILVSLVLTSVIKDGIPLPGSMQTSLPALHRRLNAFVPRILKIIRLAVFLVTVLALMEIWGILSVVDWIASETGFRLLSGYGSAFLVVLVGFLIWLAVMSWVDLRLQERSGRLVTARERTLFQLFRNASTVVIIVMVALLALSEIGVNIGPLIAGAGVVGLAISFGAQTLVKDIITGAFIQIENAINEGDVVTVAGITGTVEGITVRSVRIRDLDGTTHIIPFSSVDMVSNFMRGFSYHVALIGVSYDTDIASAKEAMTEAFRRLQATDYSSKIFGDLEMHGVTNFAASSIDIRARIKTTPGDQWSVGRAYNEFVKEVFDERSIEIPFPQVTYHAAMPPYGADAKGTKHRGKLEAASADPADDAPAEDEPT
ncbi:mechanosensitive ion channel domain-containing protein [Roseibium marinum]|uniref:Small conductance mechanosensitive channel n=1 Tax=Roseibium marinum TaxID=281252 RepID=A0A2S3ULW5_9HYPH|nr:mechanosensitive ion channel domain-containing protein [Roseibium marinum]POF28469.1 small conductance mechanosensitive channel [Roseibium marinum]